MERDEFFQFYAQVQQGWTFYFQHANPVETEHELSRDRRPQLRNAAPFESSPYYWWWRFLGDSPDYADGCEGYGDGPLSTVFADFGRVGGEETFMDWWKRRGRLLFCEPFGSAVKVIDPRSPNYGDHSFRMVIEIERFGDLERTEKELREIVKKLYNVTEAGRQTRVVSRALYQLMTKPNLEGLRQRYRALRLAKHNPGISDRDFCQTLQLSVSTKETPGMVRRRITGEIDRILRCVAQGVFPVITEKHEWQVSKYLRERPDITRQRREEIHSGNYGAPFGPPPPA
jgi:hypothetical protein